MLLYINVSEKNLKTLALIKTEILTSCEVSYTKSSTRNHFLCCKKDAFQNAAFSRLNCQLKRKKNDSIFVKILQVSADEGMGK